MQGPVTVDWWMRNAVTPVKNQGRCDSDWAFSTVGALESGRKIANGILYTFSEQQLVDCDAKDNACNGGEQATALDYVIKNGGIEGEADDGNLETSPQTCGKKILAASRWN